MSFFNFYHKNLPTESQGDVIFTVPKNINNQNELFYVFKTNLEFPDYFGENWDAFYDCLKDLGFLNIKNVHVIHEDVPFSKDMPNARLYLEILFDVVRHWWEFPQHKFYVYFPENCKAEVTSIIESRSYE